MLNSADSFFEKLEQDVQMLEDRLKQPLTTAAAVHRLKEFLSEPEVNRIRITDMVNDEVDDANRALQQLIVRSSQDGNAVDECNVVLRRLAAVISTLVYWSKDEFNELCANCVARLIPTQGLGQGPAILAAYPASYILYAIALSCVLKDDYRSLRAALLHEKYPGKPVGKMLSMEIVYLQAGLRSTTARQAFTKELSNEFKANISTAGARTKCTSGKLLDVRISDGHWYWAV